MKSNNKKMIEYQGRPWTLVELSNINNIPVSTINNRLINGWDIEKAISEPVKRGTPRPLPLEFRNGNIVEVIFTQRIGVFAHMHPILFKPYVITPHVSIYMNPVYTIRLENGKDLIVYPEEYEIFRITPGAVKAC